MYPTRATYIISFNITSPTTTPFLQLATPTNAGLTIVEFSLGQESSETSEQLVVTGQRRSTASTLPTAATIEKADPTAPASLLATTTTTNAYGIASATGTASGGAFPRWPFNALNGLYYVPPPEARIFLNISSFLTFQFVTAPTAGPVWSGYVIVVEV